MAPGRDALESELDACLTWFNHPPAGLHGLPRAGLAHLWFITIHPMLDGNGRLARTITDLALSQDERGALKHAQRGPLDITDWMMWFVAQVETSASPTVASDLAP